MIIIETINGMQKKRQQLTKQATVKQKKIDGKQLISWRNLITDYPSKDNE